MKNRFVDQRRFNAAVGKIQAPAWPPLGKPVVAPKAPPALVGMAYDYLLRFELQRRYPWAKVGDGNALGLLRSPSAAHARGFRAELAAGRAALHRLRAHCGKAIVEGTEARRFAADALELAMVETLCHGRNREGFDQEGFVDELLALLRLTPFEDFAKDRLLMNVGFGPLSRWMGGFEADLVCGSDLIEVKTVPRLDGRARRQVLKHLVLADALAEQDATFAPIENVGFYGSRQGKLLLQPASVVREQHGYQEAQAILASYCNP